MDIVLTYVDGTDPIWQKEYEDFTKIPIIEKRYRDWGLLKYLLRGVEKHMPFIKNVFLVVSHTSQVPSWANQTNLKVVLHKDIIPSEFLPTFNSTAIEMFLHKIEGLDEEYIYFNDDIIPVMDCKASDFIKDGKIVYGFSSHIFSMDMYKKQCRNSDRLSRKAAGMKESLSFTRPQHACTPMLKSECEIVYSKVENDIRLSISPLRENKNVNQYIFPNYLYHKGKVIKKRQSKKHFSLAVASPEKICKFLTSPTKTMVCINDVEMSQNKFEAMSRTILETLEQILPEKSRFEL